MSGGQQSGAPMQTRVIYTTNRDLKTIAGTGNFRTDLYYRLNTIEIQMSPLRQHQDVQKDAVASAMRFSGVID